MTAQGYAPVPPSTSYPVRLEIDYPDKQSRAKMFFRLILAIPAIFVVYFIGIAVSVVVTLGWFAVVVTGRYPRGLHTFAAGGLRWNTRVTAYIYGLTDRYPPFSLD